jgi:hypothetical protein
MPLPNVLGQPGGATVISVVGLILPAAYALLMAL